MLGVVGTIPAEELPLVVGPVSLGDGFLAVQGHEAPLTRGTAALLAAAAVCLQALHQPPPLAFLAGDIGLGQGSTQLYEYLTLHLAAHQLRVLTLHYILPMVDWHHRVLWAIQEMAAPPLLIADAGYMYVAKMSGEAQAYDLFTPDAGEMAFLADEAAPHPFYTRGFILHEDNRIPDLITRAYAHDNAARHLLVKGQKDYVATKEGILSVIDTPGIEALEPIGGTGDTLTGIAAALIAAGFDIVAAAILAARVNRVAGALAQPTPATSVQEIVNHIPGALATVLRSHQLGKE
ncbi:MAG: NAD(P)H-hydrate dehydratase [Thermodesulfobacteriota bacterium]